MCLRCMVCFFFFFSFLFYSFYLQLTYEPPPQPNCAMMTTIHMGHKTQKVEMGTRRWGPNDEMGFHRLCPWYVFFYRFFLILFIIRTRDASCVLGLFFYITTSNNGLKTHQNASQDPSPPFLPYLLRAQGPRHVSGLVLFLLFFSSPQSSRHVSGFVFCFFVFCFLFFVFCFLFFVFCFLFFVFCFLFFVFCFLFFVFCFFFSFYN